MTKYYAGWVDDPRGVEQTMKSLPFPVFGDVESPVKGTGKGQTVLLYDVVRRVAGSHVLRHQKTGDCVSMGAAKAVDVAKSVDIVLRNEPELWVAETATEDIYAGSRNVIGKGRLGSSAGSLGVWAAKWLNEYGAVPRGIYGNIDLTTYSRVRADSWGRAGSGYPTKELIEVVRQHPIQTISQVKTYEEVRDLVANGHPVTIASNQGFSSRRDSEGFARPQGSWPHQMVITAVDDAYRRPGVLVENSWGKWNSGPKRHGQPDGSFWVDADEIERRVLRSGDCWAFSGYQGFIVQKMNTRFI